MFEWLSKWRTRKVQLTERPVQSVSEICGRCKKVFADRAHYLEHKCPAAGFRTPTDYRFALRR